MNKANAVKELRRARQRRLGRALIFIVAIGLFHGGFAQEKVPLIQNRLAKEELQLAGSRSLYFIIYLQTGVLALKSRGLILREWRIEKHNSWGDSPPLESVTLQKKSTLFPPKRTRIKPAANEEEAAAFEPEALELKDMPARFTLYLRAGMRIYVRAKADGFFPRLGNLGHFFAWYVWAPLTNLSSELRKKPSAALQIILLHKEDAQSLYWALPDGIKGLIYPL
ncbi:MAG: hypothetical protein WBC70_00690 [Candidatus Aminicenantales bacterium]